jgi:hypothetical protein
MESWALDIYLPHILKFTPLRWQDSVILIKKKKTLGILKEKLWKTKVLSIDELISYLVQLSL